MLMTALAQLRVGASLAFGLPFSPWALDKLVDAARASLAEFGSLDAAAAANATGGPALDDGARAALQLRRFRQQATRAARETAYYRDLFARLGLDPSRLCAADLPAIPPTPKDAVREAPDAFVRRGARPVLWALTTGTTGRPTRVAYATGELRGIVALSALGNLAQGTIAPDDVVQVSNSSAAALGNLGVLGAAAQIGALAYLSGVIEPADSLARLAERWSLPGKKRQASVLCAYPSYLGELVEHGLRLGYRPCDFGLERVATGGEVVTAGLKERARQLFGAVRFVESYAMTETIPFGGTVCAQGHLHFHPLYGLLEVLDPETGAPARPGEVGTLGATPFAPFRDTTLLLRYDTEDLVRVLGGPLSCELRALPATGNVLGKRRLAVRHDGGWTTQRDVLEALEGIEELPLPARCGFRAVPGGVRVELLAPGDNSALRRRIERALEERGVPLRALRLVEHVKQLRQPLPLRGDLREASFALPTARAVAERPLRGDDAA